MISRQVLSLNIHEMQSSLIWESECPQGCRLEQSICRMSAPPPTHGPGPPQAWAQDETMPNEEEVQSSLGPHE